MNTIGERVELSDDALVYYVEEDDLVLTGNATYYACYTKDVDVNSNQNVNNNYLQYS